MVVLGGCGYDVLSSPPDGPPRRFFEDVLRTGRDAFDLFDLHLYGDPYQIPTYLEVARAVLRAHGCEKPIVAGEYAGPSLFEFPDAEAAMQHALADIFAAAPPDQSTDALKAQVGQDTLERRAMRALYARMHDLPPRLQMFMAGCPAALDAKRHRIACRQLVMRNVLALSEGVRRTLYWNLAPEVPGPVDPFMIMHLLIGKLPLLDYRDGRLEQRYPEAETFALISSTLAGATRVARLETSDQPAVWAFEVDFSGRAPVHVLWERRDPFDGEDAAPTRLEWKWHERTAYAVDAFGSAATLVAHDGAVSLSLSDTPLILSSQAPVRSIDQR
jgi:hypothetical protein